MLTQICVYCRYLIFIKNVLIILHHGYGGWDFLTLSFTLRFWKFQYIPTNTYSRLIYLSHLMLFFHLTVIWIRRKYADPNALVMQWYIQYRYVFLAKLHSFGTYCIKVEWFSLFCDFRKRAHCYRLAIFLWFQFQKIGEFWRQNFHFQKITGTLKINIFF